MTASAAALPCGFERRSCPQVELLARPGGEHVAGCADPPRCGRRVSDGGQVDWIERRRPRLLGLPRSSSFLEQIDCGVLLMRIAYGSVAETLARLSYTQQDGERETAGEIWQQWNDMPSLVLTGRYGTPIDPRTLNRKFTARCDAAGVRRLTVHDARRTCATLLVDLDVHPRVIMRILRHADQAVTMEIYANASSAAIREALRRLGEVLH